MQLKDQVAVKFDVLLEQICLIHSGKILCDAEELIGLGIADDTVVHMVVKSAVAQVHINCCGSSLILVFGTNLWVLTMAFLSDKKFFW